MKKQYTLLSYFVNLFIKSKLRSSHPHDIILLKNKDNVIEWIFQKQGNNLWQFCKISYNAFNLLLSFGDINCILEKQAYDPIPLIIINNSLCLFYSEKHERYSFPIKPFSSYSNKKLSIFQLHSIYDVVLSASSVLEVFDVYTLMSADDTLQKNFESTTVREIIGKDNVNCTDNYLTISKYISCINFKQYYTNFSEYNNIFKNEILPEMIQSSNYKY